MMPFPLRRAARLLAATLTLLSCAVRARQAAPEPLPTVHIGAPAPDEETASKSIISQEKLARFGDTSVMDALRHVPALNTNGAIRIVGNGGATARILVDGQAMPPGFALDSLAPQAVQRIEIYRNATAEMGGSGTGGVVNVVLARYAGQAQHRLTLAAGADGGLPNASANLLVSQRRGALDLTVSAAATRSAAPSATSEAERRSGADGSTLAAYALDGTARADFSSVSLLPRLQWHAANGDRLTAQFALAHALRRTRSDADALQTAGDDLPYAHEANRQRRSSDSASGFWNWSAHLPGGYQTELLGNASASTVSGDEQFSGRGGDDQLLLQRKQTQTSRNRRLRTAAKLRLPTAAGHAPVAGLELEVNQERRSRLVADAGPLALVSADASGDTTVRVDRVAAFAQDEWQLTPAWSVYLGLRWEQVGTASSGAAAAAIDTHASVASPLAETLWKLGATERLRMALARSYELPPTSLLIARPHLSAINSAATPDMTGNPALRPTLAWQLSAGYQDEGTTGRTFSLNLHWRHLDGALGQALQLREQRWVSLPINQRTADNGGVDADLNWKLHDSWPQAPDLELHGLAAWNRSRVHGIAGPDNHLSGEIPLLLKVGADYRGPGGQFSAGIDSSFERGSTVNQGDGQSRSAGAARSASVYARLKLDARERLTLSLSNLWQRDSVAESRAVLADATQVLRLSSRAPVQLRLAWEHRFD